MRSDISNALGGDAFSHHGAADLKHFEDWHKSNRSTGMLNIVRKPLILNQKVSQDQLQHFNQWKKGGSPNAAAPIITKQPWMPVLSNALNEDGSKEMPQNTAQNLKQPYATTDEKNNTYGSMQIDDMVKAHDTFSS